MFGFQARHIKTHDFDGVVAGRVHPIKQRMETDGWYIDFSFGLNCDNGGRAVMGGGVSGGCRDRVRFNHQGAARWVTRSRKPPRRMVQTERLRLRCTKEVVELSRAPLDAALFDVPAGYVETANCSGVYAMPSMEIDDGADVADPAERRLKIEQPAVPSRLQRRPALFALAWCRSTIVADRPVSTESLRVRLMSEIQEGGVEAVPLNAISPAEAENEAKAKQCDFILYTDISALKTSAAKKLGGMFGRAVGVGGIDKTEAKVEFKLFAVGESRPRLQSAATAKEEGDEASAGTALEQEANQVNAEVREAVVELWRNLGERRSPAAMPGFSN